MRQGGEGERRETAYMSWYPLTRSGERWHLKVKLSLGLAASTYWMATRPSMEPRANPVGAPLVLSLKMDTHRCCKPSFPFPHPPPMGLPIPGT